jgi:alpha-beta hydrolase superfamily lysophospholipase
MDVRMVQDARQGGRTPMQMETVHARDGLKLVRRRWPVPDARGAVVLVHGIAEHSGRYAHVAAQLNAWGWSVEGYDQRGHGFSPGPRGGLQRDDDLVADLGAVVATVRAEQGGKPLLLLGHSMGGLVVGCYVADLLEPRSPAGYTDVDGVIMSSPALSVDGTVPLLARAAMVTVGRLLPDLLVRTSFDPRAICNDAAVVYRYREDPLVHDLISARLARFIVEGGGYVRALAAQWTKPTLLMYAGSDRIVQPMGSAEFAQMAPPMVHAHCFEHMAHEILNEPDQVQAFHVMRVWLQERFSRQWAYMAKLAQLRRSADAA